LSENNKTNKERVGKMSTDTVSTDTVVDTAKKRNVIQAWNPPVDWVRQQIETAGTTIGSVHFKKRENGELRKMSYRLHVTNPSTAKAPKGIGAPITTTKTVQVCSVCGKDGCTVGPMTTKTTTTPVDSKPKADKKVIDKANNQMTVLDANKVVRNESGEVIGRGAWRTIPLENVVRIVCKNNEYIINRY
jgi:hypothetical protein